MAAEAYELLGCHLRVGRAKEVDETHEGRTEELNEPHAILCYHRLVSAPSEARLPTGGSQMVEVVSRVILVRQSDLVAEAALVLEMGVVVVPGVVLGALVRVFVVESAQEMAAAALVL